PRRYGAPHAEPRRIPRTPERPRAREVHAPLGHLPRDPGGGRRAGIRPLAAAHPLRAGRTQGPPDHVPRVRGVIVSSKRRLTRQIRVGSVAVGGDAPVSVQSMTTTKTADVNAT